MIEDTKILQIIPCPNAWIRYKDNDNKGAYFYSKADCLALVEVTDSTGTIVVLKYIDMDMYGIYDEDDHFQEGVVICDRDISQETGLLDKHGKEIKE